MCRVFGELDGGERSMIAVNDEEPMLLTALQVANWLNLSVRTLWRTLSRGWMPEPVRMGGIVRWRRKDIAEWVELGCPKSKSS